MFGSNEGKLIELIKGAIVNANGALEWTRKAGDQLEKVALEPEQVRSVAKMFKGNSDRISQHVEGVLRDLQKIKYFDERLRALIGNLDREFKRDFKK